MPWSTSFGNSTLCLRLSNALVMSITHPYTFEPMMLIILNRFYSQPSRHTSRDVLLVSTASQVHVLVEIFTTVSTCYPSTRTCGRCSIIVSTASRGNILSRDKSYVTSSTSQFLVHILVEIFLLRYILKSSSTRTASQLEINSIPEFLQLAKQTCQ